MPTWRPRQDLSSGSEDVFLVCLLRVGTSRNDAMTKKIARQIAISMLLLLLLLMIIMISKCAR